MNNRKGVETFADKNSPSIVCGVVHHSAKTHFIVNLEALLTIDNTIMDSMGKGVACISGGG